MTWQPLNLTAAEYAQKTDPPRYCGLVYERRRHLFSGPPESAKTLLAWIVALEAMRRHGAGVAHIDFEMGPHATRELLEDLGATADEIRSVYYVEPDGPPDEHDLNVIVDAGLSLVIIDAAAGAYDASGLDDNSRKDAEKFARTWVNPLWRAGLETILIDHVVKNSEARGRYAIGSERKVGQVDVHLGLELVKPLTRGGSGLIKIRRHRDRPAWLRSPYVAELELHSDPETHAITWAWRTPSGEATDANAFRPTVLMERASEYVRLHEPCSRNQVEKGIKGKSTDWKRTAMDLLVAEGYCGETEGARNARLLTFLRPFTTSPDLASTSPGEDSHDLASSPPASRRGEDEGEVASELDRTGEVALINEPIKAAP
jgi:hypothetical protein